MKTALLTKHALELTSLLLQAAGIAFTAWFMPAWFAKKRYGYLLFMLGVLGAALLWLGLSLLLVAIDSLTRNDVPGAGYLFEGLVSATIGLFIYAYHKPKRFLQQ